MVSEHAGQSHDPLVTIVGKIGNDSLRQGLPAGIQQHDETIRNVIDYEKLSTEIATTYFITMYVGLT